MESPLNSWPEGALHPSAKTPRVENLDQTIVQDADQRQQAQELSLQQQSAPAAEAPDIPGYVAERPLGRGSFGQVWEATQSGSGQKVAIKIFTSPGGLDFRYLQHEIAKLRQVAEHPHVVTLHDADFSHEPPYFCMGLYQESLSRWRSRVERVEIDQVVEWFDQMAAALQYTHEKGLLHCDLKPANVLLDEENRARVADFGQSVERGLPGSAIGSLGYMAPEQASLEQCCPEVSWDLYGLGATVYFLLTGQAPRLTEDSKETMGSITDPTERLERYRDILSRSRLIPVTELNPEVDTDLAQLVESCLDLDPDRRPQSARLVREDLERRSDGRPLLCRKPWSVGYQAIRFARRNTLALIAAVLLLFSLSSMVWHQYQRSEEQRVALALQEFEKGWSLAAQGNTDEAALWWARALERDPENQPSRAALNSLVTPLEGELVHGELPLSSIGFAPNGEWMVSAASDGSVKLWRDGKVEREWPADREGTPDGYYLPIPLVAFNGKGQLIIPHGIFELGQKGAVAKFDGQAHVTSTGVLLVKPELSETLNPDTLERKPVDLESQVARVAFTGDGATLATLDTEGRVHLYREGKRFAGPLGSQVSELRFSPAGDLLVTASERGEAQLWRVADGSNLQTLEHYWWVVGINFVEKGQRLLVALYNGEIRAWDLEEHAEPVVHPDIKHAWVAYGTMESSDHRFLASYSIDGKARIWDRQTLTPYSDWLSHGSAVKTVAFHPDGTQLVTGGQDGHLRLWRVAPARKHLREYHHQPGQEITAVALSPDGRMLATGWGQRDGGGSAQLWSVEGESIALLEHQAEVTDLKFSRDGSRLATTSRDGTAKLWNLEGELLETFQHRGPVRSAQFSGDSKTLLTASEDGSAYLWGETARELKVGDAPVVDAKFDTLENRVAVASEDGRCVIFELDGEGQQELTHRSALRRVVWGPSSQMILLCGRDGTALLFDLRANTKKMFSHSLMVVNGDFDEAGKKVVTTSLDGSVSVWDTATGDALASPDRHGGPVLSATFSPDDRSILTVSKDGTAQIWDTESGLPLGLPIRHRRLLRAGAFSSDGKLILTGSADAVVRLSEFPNLEKRFTLAEVERLIGMELHEEEGRCTIQKLSTSNETR